MDTMFYHEIINTIVHMILNGMPEVRREGDIK